LMKGENLGCFAITEPNAGSDLAAIATTAKLQGDH
jgi:glutaryl-CoA dehydrogenase (non-decarboxylating)